MHGRRIAIGLALAMFTTTCFGQDLIPWANDLESAKQAAAQQNKLILLHFWSYSCAPCRDLERYVFSNPAVSRSITQSFVPVKINVSEQPHIAQHFGIERIPTDVVILPNGSEVWRGISPKSADSYIAFVGRIAANSAKMAQDPIRQIAQAQRDQRFGPQVPSFQPGTPPPAADAATGPVANESPQGNPHFGVQQATAQQQARGGSFSPQPPPRQPNQNAFGQATNAASYRNSLNAGNNIGVPRNSRVDPFSDESSSRPRPTSPPQNAISNPYQRQPASSTTAQNDGRLFHGPGSATAGPSSSSPPSAVQQPVQGGYQPPSNQGFQANRDFGSQFGGRDAATTPPQAVSPAPHYSNQLRGTSTPPVSTHGSPTAPPAGPQAGPPPGQPPLAMDGFCPVSLAEARDDAARAWTKGIAQFGAIHRGRLYLFASAQHKDRFLRNPDSYGPALSCYDPVRFVDGNQLVDGRRDHGVSYRGQVFLFESEQTLQAFWQNPERYAQVVREAMQKVSGNQLR